MFSCCLIGLFIPSLDRILIGLPKQKLSGLLVQDIFVIIIIVIIIVIIIQNYNYNNASVLFCRTTAWSRVGARPVVLLLSCAKSHMLSASRRQPHLLHVSAVDRRQTWSMDKS